jgi:hypothetical protein
LPGKKCTGDNDCGSLICNDLICRFASFQPEVTYAGNTGNLSQGLAVADFNNDGHPDVAMSNYSVAEASLFMGQAGGTFSAATPVPLPNPGGMGPVAGDFNGDGKADLIVHAYGLGQSMVLFGNGVGGFMPAVMTPTWSGFAYNLGTGDLNGDGKLDLVCINTKDQNGASAALNNGNGTFTPQGLFPLTNAYSVAVGDLDNDGKADVAGASVAQTSLSGSTITLTQRTTPVIGSGPVAIADLNGDGKRDVLTVSNGLHVSLNQGAFNFSAETNYTGPTTITYGGIAVGDVNADGRPDVVVADNPPIGAAYIYIWLGRGNGALGTPTSYAFQEYCGAIGAAVVDLNGDGKSDVLVACQAGLLSVWISTSK